jgi:hypothetical protein
MRSRAVRLTFSSIAVIALAAAALFVYQIEQHIDNRRAALRDFDARALRVVRAVGDVRAAQQAYVAAGQSVDGLARRVGSLTGEIANEVDALRAAAASPAARSALMSAAATAIEIGNVDRRARGYLGDDQMLMAADVLFAEAEGTTSLAAGQLEAARTAEHETFAALERQDRRRQASAAGGAGAVAVLVLLVLGTTHASAPAQNAEEHAAAGRMLLDSTGDEGIVSRAKVAPVEHDAPRHSAPLMKAAASLCTDLARVSHHQDLTALLGKTAELMDASGIIVWLGSTGGADLRPVFAHGYPEQAIARMPPVPRQADNAAAAAYRTGHLQIVLARPGASNGALVAPLLTPDGCVGALTAEIRGRAETSDTTQSLAALVAAQLAAMLASSAATAPAEETRTERIASA